MDTQYHQPVLELVQVVLLSGRRRGKSKGNAPKGRKSGAQEERIQEKRPERKKKRGAGEEDPWKTPRKEEEAGHRRGKSKGNAPKGRKSGAQKWENSEIRPVWDK